MSVNNDYFHLINLRFYFPNFLLLVIKVRENNEK